VVVLVAIVGKYVGTYSSSRLWYRKPEASALGWLMNTRGLTELSAQHWFESCDIALTILL